MMKSTKREFLKDLRKRLSGLPRRDADERVSFYGELIDDRKLKNRADMMGKEDYFLQLKMLERNMQKG